jgi:methyl-accepting chemotaxis protein
MPWPQRTTKATKEIGEMIRAIHSETKIAINSMVKGVRGTEQWGNRGGPV